MNWDYTSHEYKRKDPNKFKVLSIDGGGIRGIFVAKYLENVENDIKEPIHKFFDLIVGTSTGGIIALGLSLGISASEIVKMYIENAKEIFKPNNTIGFDFLEINIPLKESMYDNTGLKKVLKKTFKNSTMKDSNVMLCIPSVENKGAQPIIYRTPHLKGGGRYEDEYMRNVALATSSAPIYFPAAVLHKTQCRIDGGIWANNPVLLGLAESISLGNLLSDVCILSIGTGENSYTVSDKVAITSSLLSWNIKIIDLIMSSQSKGINYLAENLLSPENLKRVDFKSRKKLHLDSIDKEDINELLYEADECFQKGYLKGDKIKENFFVS